MKSWMKTPWFWITVIIGMLTLAGYVYLHPYLTFFGVGLFVIGAIALVVLIVLARFFL